MIISVLLMMVGVAMLVSTKSNAGYWFIGSGIVKIIFDVFFDKTEEA